MPEKHLKTIISDGDEVSRQKLTDMISVHFPKIEIVSLCTTKAQTIDAIIEIHPELLILETEFSDGCGIDILQLFPERKFNVIFITGNPKYAVQAFRYYASDYLIKPVSIDEFKEAIIRISQHTKELNSVHGLYDFVKQLNLSDSSAQKLVVSNAKGFTVLKTGEIIYLEADGYCTIFHLAGKAKISSSRNLKYYEKLLPSNNFFRVHNSYIINLQHVLSYSHQGEIRLSENLTCSLSSPNKTAFLKCFKNSSNIEN